MTPLRLFALLAVLSMGCALGVAPDTRDTGYVPPPDRGPVPDLGFPEDQGDLLDASTTDDGPLDDDLDGQR